MKIKKLLIPLLLLICCTAFVFTACAEKEHNAIKTDWAKLHNIDESKINFVCYAEFGGTHVLMFDGLYGQAFSSEIVDDVVFHHNQIKTFDVYSNGEFYSLQEAFDSGLVTHNNLLTLQKIYNPQSND